MPTDQKKQTFPPTYNQRLVSHIGAANQETYTLADIQRMVKEFGKAEYEKRKATANVISFGKYKGRKVEDVVGFDRDYLSWLVKQPFMERRDLLKELVVKALAKK